MNVAAIQKLAENLVADLLTRDPLSETVHASKASFGATIVLAMASTALRRLNPFARGAFAGAAR